MAQYYAVGWGPEGFWVPSLETCFLDAADTAEKDKQIGKAKGNARIENEDC